MRLAPALLVLASTALAKPLDAVPASGAAAASFAPAGWMVESTLAGDLNGDATPDLVVVLIEKAPGERGRALLWLHGKDHGYLRVDSNVGLLPCFQCMGVKGGDGAPTLAIAKGVLVVSQVGGSRESYGSVHRFRFEQGGVRLIGVDQDSHDSLTGESDSTSINLVTGVTIRQTTPPETDEAGKPTNRKPTKTTTREKPGPLPQLNAVGEAP